MSLTKFQQVLIKKNYRQKDGFPIESHSELSLCYTHTNGDIGEAKLSKVTFLYSSNCEEELLLSNADLSQASWNY